jgi:ABC-type Fe3+ transport system permease subunit
LWNWPVQWPRLSTFLSTLAWSGAVASLAMVLAIPGAAWVRLRGWKVAPLLLVPMTLPTYLTYSGYTILRSPGTLLGDWINRLTAEGHPEVAALSGRLLAVGGLSLWAWPLGAVVLGSALRGIDPGVRDGLRLDASRWRGEVEQWRMVWRAGVAGWALILLLMLGSTIPFHLAQVKTHAIVVWLELQETASPLRAWVKAWPVVAIAATGAWWIESVMRGWQVTMSAEGSAEGAGERPSRAGWSLAGVALVMVLSVLVPLGLFAWSIRDAGELARFWRMSGESVLASGLVAVSVGVVAAVLAIFTGWALESRKRRVVRGAMGVFLFAGLSPGILVGSMWAICSLQLPAWIGDTQAILIAAHVTRFGFIGVVVGAVICACESREARDERVVIGAAGLVAWLTLVGRAHAGLIAAGAAAAGALSFHEIESSILVQPPGIPSLAQRILNDLHQLRMEAMSAAAIWLVGAGLVVGALMTCGGWWWTRNRLDRRSDFFEEDPSRLR